MRLKMVSLARRHKLVIVLAASIIGGWLLGAFAVLIAVEMTDGKALDT